MKIKIKTPKTKLQTKEFWCDIYNKAKNSAVFFKSKIVLLFSPKNDEKRLESFIGFTMFGAFIFAILAISFFFSYPFKNVDEADEKILAQMGTIGDFFGGMLNPSFALLGLMALLTTLRLNQKELSQATKQMTKSAEAAEKQVQLVEIQSLLITASQNIEKRLETEIVINQTHGRKIYKSLEEIIRGAGSVNSLNTLRDQNNNSALDHYCDLANHFKGLILLCKDLEASIGTDTTKKYYSFRYNNTLIDIMNNPIGYDELLNRQASLMVLLLDFLNLSIDFRDRERFNFDEKLIKAIEFSTAQNPG
ncbi:hypothetical protein [Neptuniibacter sp.]|uniref:hypothetical protein n=1 Tax=Neptuniibacter sp. TaxID=1962643 RepID=UPI0026148D46|nr:hypothetical protein [Neptuniibacter sp.]MCP4598262.1 hypothetical protein [Neptuniibacter sp.]